MATMLPEVEEHAIQENGQSDGQANPMAQHAYEGFPEKQSRSGLFVGIAALALVLALASIFGFWLLRSVRRLNRQVARLSRQTELLDRRVQAAQQEATASAQQASQAAADVKAAAAQRDQAKASAPTPAAQTAPPAQMPPTAHTAPVTPANSTLQGQPASEKAAIAGQAATPAALKPGNGNRHEDELQKLQQPLSQIVETRRTPLGLVMTLGEKSIRFESGKSDIAPQYRAVLNRIAGLLKPLKGYSIYVYGYTDDSGTNDYNLTLSARRARAVRDSLVKAGVDPTLVSTRALENLRHECMVAIPRREQPIAGWRSALSSRLQHPLNQPVPRR